MYGVDERVGCLGQAAMSPFPVFLCWGRRQPATRRRKFGFRANDVGMSRSPSRSLYWLPLPVRALWRGMRSWKAATLTWWFIFDSPAATGAPWGLQDSIEDPIHYPSNSQQFPPGRRRVVHLVKNWRPAAHHQDWTPGCRELRRMRTIGSVMFRVVWPPNRRSGESGNWKNPKLPKF